MRPFPHRSSLANAPAATPRASLLTRRNFLETASAALGAAVLSTDRAAAAASFVVQLPASAPVDARPPCRPRVVDVGISTDARASVNPTLFGDLLRRGLCRLTDASRPDDAWHKLLRPDDVIGIKFNKVGAPVIGTSDMLAEAIVTSLTRAGWDPRRIVLIEADPALGRALGATPPAHGYTDQVHDFGCGRDSVAASLDQVTALINVPFLKTHHLAVFTACLKNLSHGFVRRPAQFHANGCDPAVARIVASAPIRSRLRLNVVNAVRVAYRGGFAAGFGRRHSTRKVDPVHRPCGSRRRRFRPALTA